MLGEEGNPWPRGRIALDDEGMGGYIPYDVDRIRTTPQPAAPASPMTEESAKVHEKFLSTKLDAYYRAVEADKEKLCRQAQKAAKEQDEQDRAAAYSLLMLRCSQDRTDPNWWTAGAKRSMLPPKH